MIMGNSENLEDHGGTLEAFGHPDCSRFPSQLFIESLFFLLYEAIASRAVIVIVSGSDRLVGGRKRFWSQINNKKPVKR